LLLPAHPSTHPLPPSSFSSCVGLIFYVNDWK
jgi:hypothetical protein